MHPSSGSTWRRFTRHHPDIAGQSNSTRLLLACPDRPGLIAAVSGFLAEAGLNIVDADQHSSNEGRFFMRMVFEAPAEGDREELRRRFESEIASRFQMEHRFAESEERRRVAIMVSREDHCLSDLLWRWRSGELGADVVGVDDVEAGVGEEAAHRGDQAGTVGTGEEQARRRVLCHGRIIA